jgi:hypothetical protein
MTKTQALAFLADAGLITELTEVDEDHSCLLFKYRGTRLRLCTYEQDVEFLNLNCSYCLAPGLRDELEVARRIARLQSSYKVVKVTASMEPQSFTVAAEQFIPECDDFERTFWRSVDLVIRAAGEVYDELNSMVIIDDKAAERFTDQMESELQIKQENA